MKIRWRLLIALVILVIETPVYIAPVFPLTGLFLAIIVVFCPGLILAFGAWLAIEDEDDRPRSIRRPGPPPRAPWNRDRFDTVKRD